MRNLARVCLAMVVLLAGAVFLPRPAARVIAPDALAQVPRPTLTDILPGDDEDEDPSPSPSPTDDGGDGDGGSGDGGPDGGKSDRNGEDGDDRPGGKRADKLTGDGPRKGDKKPSGKPTIGDFQPTGAFSTEALVAVAQRLRALGWSQKDVVRKIYPPFIIGGDAAWSNTWGAPRFGPGPIVRKHEGQDVFCDYGAPVLASEPGTIEYDAGGLGGRVARLFRPDGSYWYYAHLSDWNTKEFSTGDSVQVGDVIGYCGQSGNARTTAPHVHFGWYQTNDKAKDTMRKLVRWLHEAERRVLGVVSQATRKRVRLADPLTLARRFGDDFTPDRSELGIASESLWASGSDPASGAFALAESALAAALSQVQADPAGDVRNAYLEFDSSDTAVLLDPEVLSGMLAGPGEDEVEHGD